MGNTTPVSIEEPVNRRLHSPLRHIWCQLKQKQNRVIGAPTAATRRHMHRIASKSADMRLFGGGAESVNLNEALSRVSY
jgi:hypothetical protein